MHVCYCVWALARDDVCAHTIMEDDGKDDARSDGSEVHATSGVAYFVFAFGFVAILAFLLVATIYNNVYVTRNARRSTLHVFEQQQAAAVAAARAPSGTAVGARAAAPQATVHVLDTPQEAQAYLSGSHGSAVLMLFAPSCPVCDRLASVLVDNTAWAAERGIKLAAISTTLAPSLLRRGDVTGTPASFFISGRGTVVVRNGALSAAEWRADVMSLGRATAYA